ncbi:MAG: hypothetical protein F6K42_00685 [Leptolyngbya sp. SIO1D8]|nr:hypothetical protein [Leptolyngbya sp. SIO1D8]
MPLTDLEEQCYALVSNWRSDVMRSAWKRYLLVPCGVLVLGLAGCDSLMGVFRTEDSVAERDDDFLEQDVGAQSLTTLDAGNVLANEELEIELTLPSTWIEETRLHEAAELQASDVAQQLYIIVLTEGDRSLTRLGLQENAEIYRNLLINRLETDGQFEEQSVTDVAFIGNNFANQYEIRGRVGENAPVVYLHTTVVTEQRYYQIVAWTTPEQYDIYKSELQNITATFRETDS